VRLEGLIATIFPYWEKPLVGKSRAEPGCKARRCLMRFRRSLFTYAPCDAPGRRSGGRNIPINRIVDIVDVVDGRLIESSCRIHAAISDEISITISRV
jgi:hypothetical protein